MSSFDAKKPAAARPSTLSDLDARDRPAPAAPSSASVAPPSRLDATGPGAGAVLLGVLRRWHVVLPLALLAGALSFGVMWFLFPSKFVAEGKLKILPRENEGDLTNLLRLQASMVRSFPVLDEALKSPSVSTLPELSGKGLPIPYLQKNLIIETNLPTLGPDEIHVSLSGDRADDVTTLLNAIQLAHLKVNLSLDYDRIRGRLIQLEAKRKEWVNQLAQARRSLEADPEQHSKLLRQAEHEFNLNRHRIHQADLSDKLTEARAKEKRFQEQMKTEQGLAALQAELEEDLRKEAEFGQLRVALRAADEEIHEARERYSGAALEKAIAAPKARLAQLQRVIDDLRSGRLQVVLARTRGEIGAYEVQIKDLDGEIAKDLRRLEECRNDDGSPKLQGLRFAMTNSEDRVKKLDAEMASLEMELPSTDAPADLRPAPARVRILEDAVTPQERRVDKQLKMAGIGGGVLFGLVLVGFLFAEYRAQRVYSSVEISGQTGLSLMGTLPAMSAPARRKGLATGVSEQNALAEAVDSVRTALLHAAKEEDLRVIMVTSASGGEGKTSLASHLAASLARAWRKTLLIDCDLRNPAAHKQFELPLEPGFSEGLRGEVEFDSAVQATTLSRLWLLPAGRCDAHAVQALAQDNVGAAFDRLKEQYDFIIIDACPVLPVADALLVGQHVDAALFAVLRDVSRVPAVLAAQQKLQSLGVRTLGAVVIGEGVDAYGRGYRIPMPAAK
jgi:capsular exopolysaccharide synthesis family protein